MPETTDGRELVVRRFAEADADRWDGFVAAAPNGTFLHTRRYLSYHGDRFDDESLIVETANGATLALLAAARAPGGADVVSHPGLTFGGLVYRPSLRGERLLEAFSMVLAELAARGYEFLDYRPVPGFAREQLGDEDVQALFRLGAAPWTCHLSAVVDVARRRPLDAKKRNMLRKAERAGVELLDGVEHLTAYWEVLTEQLGARYDATPVHTLAEMVTLSARFPEDIGLRVATLGDGVVIAGALTYRYSPGVVHTQYLTSNEQGRRTAALDLVCESLVRDLSAQAGRFLSFGPSTHEGGRVLNDSLLRFKQSFGAAGVSVFSYRVPCRAP